MGATGDIAFRVALTGGGTGGHVYPALAVAAALRRQRPEVRLLFIGGDRLEARLVPAAGLPFRAISVHGIAGHGLSGGLRRVRALAELALGLPLLQSLSVLRGFRPHVVIGTGGYVSGPVLLAARVLSIPSVVLEGNRTAGLTSRAVARLVDVVAVAYPEMARFFSRRVRRGACVVVTGLPVRQEITAITREAGAAALGLDPSLTTMLVLGGSLGSKRINEALLGALARLSEDDPSPLRGAQVLHVTGRWPTRAVRGRLAGNYRAVPYLDRLCPEALAAADVIVARAGASTAAEITARGIAAVLIPWSGTACGEQALNAAFLARAGAARVIADGDLTAERLAALLADLLRDSEARKRMAQASRELGRPEAADAVARIALDLAARRARGRLRYEHARGGRSA